MNRAISEVRRFAKSIASESFVIETIPKTGYRIVVSEGCPPSGVVRSRPSRRLILLGAAGVAIAGAAASLLLPRNEQDSRVAALKRQAAQMLRDDLPDSNAQGIGFLREAATLAPDDASIWGMLALAWRNAAEFADPAGVEHANKEAEAAAGRALSLDPRTGDALAALATLAPSFGDWTATERRLKSVLAVDPNNAAANGALGMLLQGVGRSRTAVQFTGRAAAIEPLSPVYQYRSSYLQWTQGRLDLADRTIDRALQLWPRHLAVWFARMLIFAHTGRHRAAMAMLDNAELRPPGLPEPALMAWRLPLAALESKVPADIDAAFSYFRQVMTKSSAVAVGAILFACSLNRLDIAFDFADGYLLMLGPLAGQLNAGTTLPTVNDQRQRKTMMLFIPPAAPMRADPRFMLLCRDMGLEEYWKRSGRRPDFLA